MDKKTERLILLNFLKTGFSTRKLDTLLGFSSEESNGWKSWPIPKKYLLKKEDRGILYLYSTSQCNDIIDKIMESPQAGLVDEYIKEESPKIYQMYFDKYVLAKSSEDFYSMFTGETRNITQGFFLPNKKLIGICQFKGCYETNLETAHLRNNRPDIFKKVAKKNVLGLTKDHYKQYDVYNTMRDYLLAHRIKDSICFLCKKHHTELDRLNPKNKKDKLKYKKALEVYRNLIETNYSTLYTKKTTLPPKANIPSFPLGLKLKRINKQSLTIEWKETPFSEEYILYRNGIEVDRGNKLTYNEKFKNLSGKYEYQLVASNSLGTSEISTLSLEFPSHKKTS
ncbi:hypothetical protein CN900_24590 [Bacillus anthracis]|uniref:fibronectin type III domain-containing protein n=1 Tax=Bacillus tropicus TaxID=2026188 RepID=UPI000BFC6104|nr:fibronectin type III domain-containing protein [Bacillus tropicus]PGH86692.1 hypothetical protein CN900_24590 [Bacillus anthracis]PGV30947.1 hypothetical protein COD75_26385 [Bacillus anthracis]